MKNIFFTLFIMVLTYTMSHATTNDSLVYWSEINFDHQAEKKYFYNLLNSNSKNDLLLSFLHIADITDSASIKESEIIFNDFISQLNHQISDKKFETKVDLIKQRVTENFLKNYTPHCILLETLMSGKYNCLTATCMYALVFNKLNIPFQIKEEINQIAVIATSKEKNIKIDMQSPNNKCFSFSENYRDKCTKSMFYAGIIPYNEFEKGYSDTLFEKYYFKNSDLSMTQLASMVYSQISLYYADEIKLQEAFNTMQKAYLLDADIRNRLTLKYHIFNTLGRYNYESTADFEKIIYLCRYNNMRDVEINSELINSEFQRYLSSQIRLQNGLEMIEKDYQKLIQNSTNISLKNEISFSYNFQMARQIVNDVSSTKNAIPMLSEAYRIKPKDVDLNSLIMHSLSNDLSTIKEGDKALELVEKYCNLFDDLSKSSSIALIKTHCYLDLAYRSFKIGNIIDGDSYLKKSEKICSEYSLSPEIAEVEKGYVSAAKYFFNNGNKPKAKEYLIKGFEYAPESQLILDKLKLVK